VCIRLNWSVIESAAGVFNLGPIDKSLTQTQANGQRLAFRIMRYGEGNGGPVALRNAGSPGFAFVFSGTDTWVPNLDDIGVQQDLKELITALGRRHGDNPAIDSVDLGRSRADWELVRATFLEHQSENSLSEHRNLARAFRSCWLDWVTGLLSSKRHFQACCKPALVPAGQRHSK
jgi:hypothetical protein